MSDIVSELLDRAYSHKPNDFLCERAAMEIERLRNGAVTGCETVRLTDAEREAVEFFVGFHTEGYGMIEAHAATLRSLLERMK